MKFKAAVNCAYFFYSQQYNSTTDSTSNKNICRLSKSNNRVCISVFKYFLNYNHVSSPAILWRNLMYYKIKCIEYTSQYELKRQAKTGRQYKLLDKLFERFTKNTRTKQTKIALFLALNSDATDILYNINLKYQLETTKVCSFFLDQYYLSVKYCTIFVYKIFDLRYHVYVWYIKVVRTVLYFMYKKKQ